MATLSYPQIFPKFLNDLRRTAIMGSDVAVICASYCAAFAIRFDMGIPPEFLGVVVRTLPLVILVRFATFWYFGLYRGLWRFASVIEVFQIIKSVLVSSVLLILIFYFMNRFDGYPRSIFLIDALCLLVLVSGSRFVVPLLKEIKRVQDPGGKRILIVGAGSAGESILQQMFKSPSLHYKPVGLIDDDPKKIGSSIRGVKVLGDSSRICEIAKRLRAEEIIFAIPSATGTQMRRIVNTCKESGIAYKTLPSMADIIDGKASVNSLREVDFVDLIGRPPVRLDMNGIREYLSRKTVLVTGCGGSIGSELCRQIVRFEPREIVLLDCSEENLFRIQMQLKNEMHFSAIFPVLGRVQNRALTESIFRKYLPEVVFHAAACKHVPMTEFNPWEAVFNNVMASRVLTELAVEHGVGRCVLVSTDKAVQPSNVMGATKRITEIMVHCLDDGPGSHFMAVRFGNVVGSSGSVIPLFRRQIEYGGPVTVTEPEVTRYFMTIPEASQLILQAAALGKGGEIFVLDMGTPIKIADLAMDLIRLSGREPGRDIEIVFTGLREGEKLHEKLITADENLFPTSHEKILVLKNGVVHNGFGSRADFRNWFNGKLDELIVAARVMDAQGIKRVLQEIVPEYTPQEVQSVLKN